MIAEKSVLWVDDEPNLMDAELFDLENNHFSPIPFQWVGEALSWVFDHVAEIDTLKGVVVDVQLPSRLDVRFANHDGIPVGVKFCECLKENAEVWSKVKSKIVLYTRLPHASAAAMHADKFAHSNGIIFRKKTQASRVALDLISERLLVLV